MVQPQAALNPHFAIDFGRVREVRVGLEEPSEVVRRVARRQIPQRILCTLLCGGGERRSSPDAPARSNCAKFVWIFLHARILVLFAVELHNCTTAERGVSKSSL